ncbi:MAG: hypothetical protein GYA14_12550 [Ignavibacteria bacterium]|nr:hypothetical protein [Ignavibacteria bacterium]
MKKIKLSSIIILLLTAVIVSACCNCGQKQENYLQGEIVVVENEPFTRLALKLNNNAVYFLECSDALNKELRQKQGSFYSVMFRESKIENGIPVLVVEEAVPVKQ